jgi:hypothetical protein
VPYLQYGDSVQVRSLAQMNYLKKYDSFKINESKENVFKELSNLIIDKFNKKDYYFTIDNYSKVLNKRKFKLKKLKVLFNLIESDNNFCNGLCNVTESYIKDDYLLNTSLSFDIEYINIDDDFIRYINSIILHEVMYLYQVYNLKINNKFKPESWVIGSLIPTLRKFLKEGYTKQIIDLLYYSLSHEMYSQLQQYYFYKKDKLEYNKISQITDKLSKFEVKKRLTENEIIEISNLKRIILKGLNNNDNIKYKKNVNKSFWNEEDNYIFLSELNKYFKKKSNLIKLKIKKIDKEFNLDEKINDSLNNWTSLPTNYDELELNHFDILDSIIFDVFY